MALTIGQLAAQAGVNIQTVRYYERRGLMPRPARSRTGYRQYRPEAADRLAFIKRAQDLGFSLEEIAELLALRVKHASACGTVEARARDKVVIVERKIAELKRMKRTLERLAAACQAREPTSECPILEALEEHQHV
jgi:MerR family copper efflux transcriptional regulator